MWAPGRRMTVFIFQGGRCLENYVQEFIDTCSNLTLIEGFRVELDEEIQFVMPRDDTSWSFAQYLTFTLWISEPSYQVGEMEAVPAPESSPNMTAVTQSSLPATADSSLLARITPNQRRNKRGKRLFSASFKPQSSLPCQLQHQSPLLQSTLQCPLLHSAFKCPLLQSTILIPS